MDSKGSGPNTGEDYAKKRIDGQLGTARQLTNPAERAARLIDLAGRYLHLRFFVDCSDVLREATDSVGKVRDKVEKEGLQKNIQTILERKRHMFMAESKTETSFVPDRYDQ